MKRFVLTALLMTAPFAVQADDVTDTLNSALNAYNEGDIQYAIEEIDYAKQLMRAMKKGALEAFLPEPPAGWTREIDSDMAMGLGAIGGGVGTSEDYTNGSENFSITLMADNPMVGAMAGMIGSAGAMGAKIERVGREKFMVQNDEFTGLVDGRILVQASGDNPDLILEILKSIDYKALGDFGQ